MLQWWYVQNFALCINRAKAAQSNAIEVFGWLCLAFVFWSKALHAG